MDTNEFISLASDKIKDYDFFHFNNEGNKELKVIIVWANHTIQNNKAMFIVKNIKSQMILPYFIEVTYNGDVGEMYLDFYIKECKHVVKID